MEFYSILLLAFALHYILDIFLCQYNKQVLVISLFSMSEYSLR